MSDIVSMLTNKNEIVTSPLRAAFYVGRETFDGKISSKEFNTDSMDAVTASKEIEARNLTNKHKDPLHDTWRSMIKSKPKMMKQSLSDLSFGIKESLEQSELEVAPTWVTLLQVDDD
ncbi:hypothetical protein CR513_57838, partial [Mucuna pruriens]